MKPELSEAETILLRQFVTSPLASKLITLIEGKKVKIDICEPSAKIAKAAAFNSGLEGSIDALRELLHVPEDVEKRKPVRTTPLNYNAAKPKAEKKPKP